MGCVTSNSVKELDLEKEVRPEIEIRKAKPVSVESVRHDPNIDIGYRKGTPDRQGFQSVRGIDYNIRSPRYAVSKPHLLSNKSAFTPVVTRLPDNHPVNVNLNNGREKIWWAEDMV